MRQRMLTVALIGAMGAIGCIVYLGAAVSTRPRSASYREAVMRVLDQRHVDYRDVVVVDGCAPSYQFCRSYAGAVQVQAGTTMPARIECRERWTTCTLTVPRMGISGAPLDDVVDPLVARWEELYGQFILKLRQGPLSVVSCPLHCNGQLTTVKLQSTLSVGKGITA